MPHHPPALPPRTRRRFLTLAGAAAASGLGLGTLAHLSAVAQSAPDYKALVCLFLFGGNDGNNLLVPLDGASHAQYERIRPNLARARDALLPIAPSNTGGRPFGLHPALGGLQRLFTQGRAAMLANVGPLLVPTTKAALEARRIAVPDNLYSHSDQQAQWQSGAVDGAARSGWGGRLMERLLAGDARNRGYGLLSMAGGNLWENGDVSLQPYKVSPSGRFGFDFYEAGSTEPLSVAIAETLAEPRGHLLEQAWNDVVGRSIENQRVLTRALEGGSLATDFPGTGLGRQLQMVARLISARANLGLARQCFFCSIGGFDTHGDDQLQRQNELFAEIGSAVEAFHAATVELGVANQVTLFSASDFGRTLASNGAGTDHGWGNHHFVVGGAVKGGQIVGRFPELVIDGPDDVGQGVWIPGIAVDQLGATLGRWFGAGTALGEVFPRLGHFDADLGFMA